MFIYFIVCMLYASISFADELKFISPNKNSEVVCSKAVFAHLAEMQRKAPEDYEIISRKLRKEQHSPCEVAKFMGLTEMSESVNYQSQKSEGMSKTLVEKYNEEMRKLQ